MEPKTSLYSQILDLKVVIPSTYSRAKKLFFRPSLEATYDQTVWNEKCPDKFLEAPNVELPMRCGHYALTKSEKYLKNVEFPVKKKRFLAFFHF